MRVPGVGSVDWQPVYDTISLAIGATTGTFFSVPVGGAIGAGVKGLQHTNLIQAGRLETGYKLRVMGLSMWFPEVAVRATQADIRAIQSGSFQLHISNAIILTLPIAMIPNAGAELVLVSNIAAAVTEYQLNKGVSAAQNYYALPPECQFDLDEQQTVQAVIAGFHTAPVAVTVVSAALHGRMSRPVVG